jgi:hypothetical protein
VVFGRIVLYTTDGTVLVDAVVVFDVPPVPLPGPRPEEVPGFVVTRTVPVVTPVTAVATTFVTPGLAWWDVVGAVVGTGACEAPAVSDWLVSPADAALEKSVSDATEGEPPGVDGGATLPVGPLCEDPRCGPITTVARTTTIVANATPATPSSAPRRRSERSGSVEGMRTPTGSGPSSGRGSAR